MQSPGTSLIQPDPRMLPGASIRIEALPPILEALPWAPIVLDALRWTPITLDALRCTSRRFDALR